MKRNLVTELLDQEQTPGRRSGSDRRADSDRRRSGGLFEVRARRDGTAYDRRQGERRERGRSWLSFLRRDSRSLDS